MGMFDYVDAKLYCPVCGNLINNLWQTKCIPHPCMDIYSLSETKKLAKESGKDTLRLVGECTSCNEDYIRIWLKLKGDEK